MKSVGKVLRVIKIAKNGIQSLTMFHNWIDQLKLSNYMMW